MASTLKVDNIIATDGTTAPITLSGDAATLGSAVTFPAGTMVNFTETTTTPTATQGDDTSFTDLTGSSVDYTPATGSSFVVYTYQTHMINKDNTPIIHYRLILDGSEVANEKFGHQSNGSDGNSGMGMMFYQFILPSYSGSKNIHMEYQAYSSSYECRLHYAVYPSNLYVKIHRTTYSIM